jgi:hypothetical protein
MEEKQIADMIMERYQQWKQNQQGQTNGYEFERSFDVMWREMGQQIMQEGVGELPSDKRKKNDKNQLR